MTTYRISLSDAQADKLADWLSNTTGEVDSRVAEEIRAQIPKPAIEEPIKFGSVVRTETEGLFVRLGAAMALPWGSGGSLRRWDQLDVVEVLRVGIGEPAPTDADEFMVSAGFSPYLQQIRDLLHRSPSGHLTHEEVAAAYKELRKGLSGLLEDS